MKLRKLALISSLFICLTFQGTTMTYANVKGATLDSPITDQYGNQIARFGDEEHHYIHSRYIKVSEYTHTQIPVYKRVLPEYDINDHLTGYFELSGNVEGEPKSEDHTYFWFTGQCVCGNTSVSGGLNSMGEFYTP